MDRTRGAYFPSGAGRPEDVRVVVQGGDPVQRPGDDGGFAFDVGVVDEAAVGVQVGA